jgi:hypothetical protein
MECPQCGGPLHAEADVVFACERGHALDADQLGVAAGSRATAALWMAIAALETEAAALRMLASMSSADGKATQLADRAEEDALILRKISTAHVPPDRSYSKAGAAARRPVGAWRGEGRRPDADQDGPIRSPGLLIRPGLRRAGYPPCVSELRKSVYW